MYIDLKLKTYEELQFEVQNLIIKNYSLQQENKQLRKQKEELKEYLLYQLESFDFEKDIKARMLCSMVLVMLNKDKINELEGDNNDY